MPGRVRPFLLQGYVQGDDVALRDEMIQRYESARTFRPFARRVVQQHLHSEYGSRFGHLAAHVSHANHSQDHLRKRQATLARESHQERGDILFHAPGIASGGVSPDDAVLLAPCGVDVVESYGCGSYHLHRRTLQQRCVAAGAGAGDQGVGVAHHLCGGLLPGEINYVCVWLEGPAQEGYLVITYNARAH